MYTMRDISPPHMAMVPIRLILGSPFQATGVALGVIERVYPAEESGVGITQMQELDPKGVTGYTVRYTAARAKSETRRLVVNPTRQTQDLDMNPKTIPITATMRKYLRKSQLREMYKVIEWRDGYVYRTKRLGFVAADLETPCVQGRNAELVPPSVELSRRAWDNMSRAVDTLDTVMDSMSRMAHAGH